MSQHVLYSIETCTGIDLQGAEGVSGAVEGDVLSDARCLQPVLQGGMGHFYGSSDKCIGNQ